MKCKTHETEQGYYTSLVGEDDFRKYYAIHYIVACNVCDASIFDTFSMKSYKPRVLVISKGEERDRIEYTLKF